MRPLTRDILRKQQTCVCVCSRVSAIPAAMSHSGNLHHRIHAVDFTDVRKCAKLLGCTLDICMCAVPLVNSSMVTKSTSNCPPFDVRFVSWPFYGKDSQPRPEFGLSTKTRQHDTIQKTEQPNAHRKLCYWLMFQSMCVCASFAYL